MRRPCVAQPRTRTTEKSVELTHDSQQHHDMVLRVILQSPQRHQTCDPQGAACQTAEGGASTAQKSRLTKWLRDRWHHGVCWFGAVTRVKPVVCFTHAAETQNLFNELGHTEWIAAHLAEMLCSNFAEDQQSDAFHRSRLQCVLHAKSLSSPVECRRENVFFRSCHCQAMHDKVGSHDSVGTYG